MDNSSVAPGLESQRAQINRWNARYPVGTRVVVTRDNGSEIVTRTRSGAQLLSGHTAVIFLEGISGCYLLGRVRAL
jgi:hypothetical protein